MVDNKGRFLIRFHGTADGLGRFHASVGIEVSRGFVEQVEVGLPTEAEGDGDGLSFTAGQFLDAFGEKLVDAEGLDDVHVEFTTAPAWTQLAVQPKLNRPVNVHVDVLRFVGDGRLCGDPTAVVFVLACEDFDHGGFPGPV